MNEAQTAILEDEGVNELDWRIYTPKTHRLDIYIGNEERKTQDWPRLWAMDGCDDYGPDCDIVWLEVDSDTFSAASWRDGEPRPFARKGTWRRYLEDVASVRRIVETQSWTLTDEESALFAALEEYGQLAPARYVTAA